MSKSSPAPDAQSTQKSHRVPPYRRPIIVVSFFFLLIAAIAATIIIFKNLNAPDDSSSTPASSLSPSIVHEPADQPENPDPLAEPADKVTQYEGEDPNTLPDLTGRVAYKAVNREPTYESLTVAASIDQYLSSGTCTFRLLDPRGSAVYVSSLSVEPSVSTSTCGPFEVPIADFAAGAYQIEITVTSNDKTGVITDGVQL